MQPVHTMTASTKLVLLVGLCLGGIMGSHAHSLPRRLGDSLQQNPAVSLDQPALRLLLGDDDAPPGNSTQQNSTLVDSATSNYAKRPASFSSVDDGGALQASASASASASSDGSGSATAVAVASADAFTVTPDIVQRAKDWLAQFDNEPEPAAVVSGGIKSTLQQNPSLAFVPYAG